MRIRFLFAAATCLLASFCTTHTPEEPELIMIRELKDFVLDGKGEEWKEIPERKLYADPYGLSPGQSDLKASFKLAWKEEYLLLFISIEDDGLTADTISPWKGDAVEFFLSDGHGSENIVQYSLVTGMGKEGKAPVRIRDIRKMKNAGWKEPTLINYIRYFKNNIYIEAAINYSIFGNDSENERINFQLYVNDIDPWAGDTRNQLTWHHLGHSYMNSFANYPLQLTEKENTLLPGSSRLVITDEEKFTLYVFGAKEKDKISVFCGQRKLFDTLASTEESGIPEIIDFPAKDTDILNDSVLVFLNNQFLSSHNLILSPRIHEKTKTPPFEREINLFRLSDRLKMPDPGSVLFIGSSSIRMWESIYRDFPGLNIIHRGFGGSNSADALEYIDDIVLPYDPSAIIYYEGDNDIAQGLPLDQIISNMEEFVARILSLNPDTQIYLLSPKPAIVRMHLWEKYRMLHEEMNILANRYSNVHYVDVASAMFNSDGTLMETLFLEDSLHMNEAGYAIWTQILQNTLKPATKEK